MTNFSIYSTFFKEKLRNSRKILEFPVIKLKFFWNFHKNFRLFSQKFSNVRGASPPGPPSLDPCIPWPSRHFSRASPHKNFLATPLFKPVCWVYISFNRRRKLFLIQYKNNLTLRWACFFHTIMYNSWLKISPANIF